MSLIEACIDDKHSDVRELEYSVLYATYNNRQYLKGPICQYLKWRESDWNKSAIEEYAE